MNDLPFQGNKSLGHILTVEAEIIYVGIIYTFFQILLSLMSIIFVYSIYTFYFPFYGFICLLFIPLAVILLTLIHPVISKISSEASKFRKKTFVNYGQYLDNINIIKVHSDSK